ncbi:MAG: RsmB/NOP family class I SAM-dependent RNA methyltransferase, partial [Pseudomonadota bacterium]|nr:RsmB/NOP family class I SAM-dependent RNA methyltransferase [Pseudomonadota bacterium]
WRKTYGDAEAAAIARSHVDEPPLDISVRSEPHTWAARLAGGIFHDCTVRLADNGLQVSALPGYADGRWWVQDAASALPARLLGDVRKASVLDLCAAPGGKTAQLAAAGAVVTAVDRSPARVKRLEQNLSRLKLAVTSVVAEVHDYVPARLFDAVLLDAPCSGTGTIRRHPDLPFHRTPAEIAELAVLQRCLLDKAASFVRPGGRLVFSTCSLEPEEGEEHLQHLPEGMALVPIAAGEYGLEAKWVDARGCLRTRPSQGLDGFFAMRLRRL